MKTPKKLPNKGVKVPYNIRLVPIRTIEKGRQISNYTYTINPSIGPKIKNFIYRELTNELTDFILENPGELIFPIFGEKVWDDEYTHHIVGKLQICKMEPINYSYIYLPVEYFPTDSGTFLKGNFKGLTYYNKKGEEGE